jgi:hypothetical protein
MSNLEKRFKNSKFSKQYYSQKAVKEKESGDKPKRKRAMPKRSLFEGSQMDSGSELEFAKMLKDANINWVKNTKTVFYYMDSKGKKRKYIPDFYLPDIDFWIEIKGSFYRSKNDKRKLKSVGENIAFILSDNLHIPEIIFDKLKEINTKS